MINVSTNLITQRLNILHSQDKIKQVNSQPVEASMQGTNLIILQ